MNFHNSSYLKKSCFLFFVSLSLNTSAQLLQTTQVRSLTVDNGLPQGFITGIAQDQTGFIWISTMDGLARYDGDNVKIWHHDDQDTNSISSNVITGMIIDRQDNLWLIHENLSIDLVNAFTGKVRHISREKKFNWLKIQGYQEYCFLEDAFGQYWNKTAEQTIQHFSFKNPQPVNINFQKNEVPVGMYQNKMGLPWIVTNKALYHEIKEDKLEKIVDLPPQDSSDFEGNFIIDNSGNFLFGHKSYISLYNLQNHEWSKIDIPKEVPQRSKNFSKTNKGEIYMSGNGSIYHLNKAYQFSLVWQNNTNPPEFTTFMIDRSNVIWAGTNTFGTRMINTETSGFTSYKLPSNFINDYLLKLWSAPSLKNSDDFSILTLRSCKDPEGMNWYINLPTVNTDSSLYKISRIKNDTARTFLFKKYFPGRTRSRTLNNIAIDKNNRVWVVIKDDTLVQADLKTKKFIDPVILNPNKKIPNYVFAVGNKLWIIYYDALELFDPVTKQSTWFKDKPGASLFRNSYLLMAVADSKNKNILWIATRGNGLIKFDSNTGSEKIFTEKNGLPNNTVYMIVPDKDGYLWCSSNKGIFRFSPADYSVLPFTVEDGLQGNEFNRYQAISFPDGKIAFGGTQGWTTFYPDSINLDQFQPSISVTGIEVNNNPLSQFNKWKNTLVSDIDTLSLSHDQNFITFHFAGLEFNDPGKLNYRYMLSGVDKKWVNAGTENVANYTNLPPGKFDFKVEASNTSGVWSNKTKTINIVITPPWWKTWWAYVLYFLVLGSLIFIIFDYRLKQIKVKHEIALKKKEAEQLKSMDEVKSRFFSNITHEFRTPLSLIISPVEQMQSEPNLSPLIKKKLSMVQRNAQQLLRLINQLLDMSKIESGNMKLSLSRGELNLFAEECVEAFKQHAESKKIKLQYSINKAIGEYLFDSDKLQKVFYNLISNAIKFTPENGRIKVVVSVDKDENSKAILHLMVSDTGIGIDEKKLPEIFNRFYQVDASVTRKYEGTGIGLALVKELVELMNGSIEVKSETSKGTNFDVFVPVQKPTTEQAPQCKSTEIIDGDKVRPLIDKTTSIKKDSPLLLIVEDNEELRAFISRTLEEKYNIITAANGKQALTLATTELPDIIISDVMMPEMDGYALCKEIKSNLLTDHIAVVLLTAKLAHESVIEGLNCGADDYITKPFHFDELGSRIHNILERQEKLRLFFQQQLHNPYLSIDKKDNENSFINQLYDIIEKYLDDTTLNVEKLATKAAVSHRTLNRKLSAIIGLSANELIRQYRLKRSIDFLKSGNNVSETAYSVGFETHSYFTTSFKSFFGITPSEYISNRVNN